MSSSSNGGLLQKVHAMCYKTLARYELNIGKRTIRMHTTVDRFSQTYSTGAASSIPPCVTFETSLVRKATGNPLMNSTSLEKTQSPFSGFCYAQN